MLHEASKESLTPDRCKCIILAGIVCLDTTVPYGYGHAMPRHRTPRSIAARDLALAAHTDQRTADRWLRGARGLPAVDAALAAAAERMGLARETAAAA